eukprot:350571-Chlamydomonas_euryale.AAC.2
MHIATERKREPFCYPVARFFSTPPSGKQGQGRCRGASIPCTFRSTKRKGATARVGPTHRWVWQRCPRPRIGDVALIAASATPHNGTDTHFRPFLTVTARSLHATTP